MPTEVLSMLENLSASTNGSVELINTPKAWIIAVNGVERFRLEKDDD